MSTMYDNYLIVGEDFKNVTTGSKISGFQLGIRVPYYRGVYLSLFEGIELSVDGERFEPARIMLTLDDKTYPLTRLPDETDDRWEFGQVGILTVDKPGGLAPGEHEIELKVSLNIYYMGAHNQPNIAGDTSTWGVVSGGSRRHLSLRS